MMLFEYIDEFCFIRVDPVLPTRDDGELDGGPQIQCYKKRLERRMMGQDSSSRHCTCGLCPKYHYADSDSYID